MRNKEQEGVVKLPQKKTSREKKDDDRRTTRSERRRPRRPTPNGGVVGDGRDKGRAHEAFFLPKLTVAKK